MADQPVAELFAELGFDVDQAALAGAERGLKQIEQTANRAVAAVDSMGGALARAGGKTGFWSGIKQSFKEGMAQGAQPRAGDSDFIGPVQQKQGLFSGIKQSFREGMSQGFKEAAAEAAHAPAAAAPHAPAGGHDAPGGHGSGPKGLTGVLDNAQHALHGFLGLFAAHEVAHFAHELMEMSSSLELSSKRLGVTTEELQQLQYAANASDIAAGSLNNGLKFLQINSTKAAQGGKGQAKVFKELGVAVKDADGNARPIGDLLEDVADGFQKIDDPAKQTALAMQVFGRAGVEMVPMLQEGGEGIRKLREEAEALGGGLTETLIENAGKYEKALKAFNFAFLGVKSAIGNFLLPMLTKLSMAFTSLAGWFNTISTKTKFLQTLLGVGLVATLVKVAMWLNTVGAAGVLAWLKNIGPIILMAATIAGVTLVLEDLYQALTGGKSAIGKWLENWQGLGTLSELVKNIAAGFDSIKKALNDLWNAPGATLLKGFKGLLHENSPLANWMKEKGIANEGEFADNTDREAAANERANRPVALGRGVDADAQSNIDIPRALGRGLNADAVTSFGQAKGSIFNAQSANGDSPVNVTINAHTNASPKEIARHTKAAIEEHQQKQNRNIRRALVPHAER